MRVPSLQRVRLSTVLLAASVVLGTALLLWGADALARWTAERFVARQVEASTGVLQRPSVEVHGTFFLPQMFGGRYERVQISVEDVRSGPLRLERVTADLTGVHVPFADLVRSNPAAIYIERSRERATLTFDDINHYLDVTGRPVSVRGGPGDELVLSGTAEVLGQQVSASSRVVLGVEDGALTVRPTELETGTDLDGASRLLLRQRFSFRVPLDPLPFGQQIVDLVPGQTAVEVEARGTGVVVQP